MTQARSQLVDSRTPAFYHCVQRCVRRAFLCGVDSVSGQDFSHRKEWIEERLRLLAECFAVSIHAYAVMSNHLHVVLHIDPFTVDSWNDAEVAQRWVRLFPPREVSETSVALKQQMLLDNPVRLMVIRERLSSLSWLMKCLAEPIARWANLEDGCTGRFWQGRFKTQLLCDEKALLAAMAYVDLNPVRAGMTALLEQSHHTSVKERIVQATNSPALLRELLKPCMGLVQCLPFTLQEYLELVEFSGQQWHPNKRGKLIGKTPRLIQRIEAKPERWMLRVKGMKSGYWRIVGELSDVTDKAKQLKQRWMKGINFAKQLAMP
jgi:hypothetical protein